MALHNLVSAMVQCLTGTDLVATHNWLCWRHWLLAPPLQSALTCPSSSSHSSLQYSRLSQLNVNSIPALLPALLLSDLVRRKGRRLAPVIRLTSSTRKWPMLVASPTASVQSTVNSLHILKQLLPCTRQPAVTRIL